MPELSPKLPENSSPNTSIKVEALNDDIRQLVNRINALVDIEFEIKMAQKKLDYSTTYKNKCITAIDVAKSNCEKATKVYSDLKLEAEGTPKEHFRKLYSQLSSKNSDSNGSHIPIDEWDLGLDCKYTTYTNPVFAEPTPSRFSRSIFSAKHHYTHGRNHSTVKGALSHHLYLSGVYEDMLNKSELLNTSLRLREDCIQKNLNKIEESLNSLQIMEKNYQNEYNEYVVAVKGKLKEFKKFQEAMGEDYTGNQNWWSTLSFRSHKPKNLEKLAHPEDLTSFDTPQPFIGTSTAHVEPTEPAKPKSTGGSERNVNFAITKKSQKPDQVPSKFRFCMQCDQKTEYRQVNPCEWKCMGCESRKLEVKSPSKLSQSSEMSAEYPPPHNIDGFMNSIRSRVLKNAGDADSVRVGPSLPTINEPLNPIDDNCESIYVGPKGGKTVKPNEMNPLELMFARNT